ncbi:hypothetical protein HYPSUDRAFT_209812 [Hypholoma sublateritium FD-334 SS-4]|uniref:Uncharacterized protein n=1 Tax=Hypholoma sublateritium (strain FD-334 SS-4) TaxID=945553 RepID=A0A0D2KFB7_HYPSF|nr:hypothetical protein HYPSUDRAFT_209812 [Hypholoma sublateritium FD-334 SS-4]
MNGACASSRAHTGTGAALLGDAAADAEGSVENQRLCEHQGSHSPKAAALGGPGGDGRHETAPAQASNARGRLGGCVGGSKGRQCGMVSVLAVDLQLLPADLGSHPAILSISPNASIVSFVRRRMSSACSWFGER